MDSEALKTVFYAGIKELAFNKRYFYHSGVGANYSHLTDEGERAVLDYVKIMAPLMREAEERALDQRAKDMVMSTLKGENND